MCSKIGVLRLTPVQLSSAVHMVTAGVVGGLFQAPDTGGSSLGLIQDSVLIEGTWRELTITFPSYDELCGDAPRTTPGVYLDGERLTTERYDQLVATYRDEQAQRLFPFLLEARFKPWNLDDPTIEEVRQYI